MSKFIVFTLLFSVFIHAQNNPANNHSDVEKPLKTMDISPKKFHEDESATKWLFARKAAQNLVEAPLEKVESLFHTLTLRNAMSIKAKSKRKLKREDKWERKRDEKRDQLMKNYIEDVNQSYGLDGLALTGDEAKDKALICAQNQAFNFDAYYKDLADIVNKVNQHKKMCICSAWSDCENRRCSCSRLCPFDFTLFRKTADQAKPTKDNQLHFRNHQNSIYKYKELTGFCWGHATVAQRMSQLAVFRPDKKIEHPEGSKKWVKHYKRVIDDLVHNRATNVDGFNNLYEFSGHPAFEEYIALQVSKVWAKQAAEIGNLSHFIRLRSQKKDNLKFVKKMKDYLDFNVTPVVVKSDKFSELSEVGYAHVVVAYKYEDMPDGSTRIYFRDNSDSIKENEKQNNYVEIKADGTRKGYDYDLHLEDRHFKRDIVRQVYSMQALCIENMCR